ncbi:MULTISPECIES: M3 family metallopeptidase [unclassified Janthinobacterium]|uniref:M3 family metallopeptidase n=1 Tax=unclassified Janthinobacterium TaxID=2610881 RepID=UPI001610ABC1|nr:MULTISPECIES: M3 family metallopeptidase [unclassified Janthinobacterium]MBB5371545.1 peptidyl-dipeptidase Dcp [Janthinobacterium sp. K2C7]MBB5384387.1 peptidyl-dipeptidase Dcp [Janthinobacterium sp. K2Li3]MBB5389663.1 peptidyl-dipeptidase Dcp [Janthinobacterium sp. K2E3]
MTRPKLLVIAASLMLAQVAYAATPAAATANAPTSAAFSASNPFFKASPLPFQMPQFGLIKNEHYLPAFLEGMKRQTAEVNHIANNPKPATFDNTIVALERSGQLLHRVNSIFSNMAGANTNDEIDKINVEISPKLAAHDDSIHLNAKLFARIEALYDQRDKLGLDAESVRLLERYHTDFVRAGAKLSAADQEKLKAYNGELAALQTTFLQNVLKEANAKGLVVDTRAELDGMTASDIDTAAAEAKKRGLDGKFVIALTNTSGQAPLAVLTNRNTRTRLMQASLNRGIQGGEFDNRGVVLKLAKLRADRAALLGYPNYAAYSLEDETIKNTQTVNTLLSELAKPAVANAHREAADLQKLVDADKGGFQVEAQDWAIYTDKLRAERFHFDENQLKPYLELNNVLTNGVFFAANKLYGITFKERKDLPVYNPDVRVYDVFDANGKPLAIFLEDFYARGNKQGGAWMNEYVSQSSLLGTHPVIANQLNIPKPPAGQPTLLTFDEVTTMFHEFGHALHGMFSNVKYPYFSGTNVPRDFVEYPSQFNETWAVWPEVLQNYAKHYQTGAPMPQDLLDKVKAAKKFNQGFMTTEYIAAALLDQRWHQLSPSQIPTDVVAFEAAALKDAGVDFPPVPPRYRTTYFSHSFNGEYSAAYYAYLWSEKLDADTAEWFKENGGLTRKNGDWFRSQLLSRGGSVDALQLYRNFRGRDAKIEPLLESRGLNTK